MARLNKERFKFDKDYSFDNFFIQSKATFKVCKKPKRKPDYVSYKRDFYKDKVEFPFIFKELFYEIDFHKEGDVNKVKKILSKIQEGEDFPHFNKEFYIKTDSEHFIYEDALLSDIRERGIERCISSLEKIQYDFYRKRAYSFSLNIKVKSEISSRYWYGEDSKGQYVIRESDHWGQVASCVWHRTMDYNLKGKNSFVCAKSYINLKKATS
ncbi:hypothetical protein [Riemerella anatipestifer]|uniref:Uncharacterized protein n=1 Tax=Riemerella anatipestifer TaxID=34085 RepID=A0A1S7DQL3_RIEAN|nr:hypothetical protein [Riemerella anatipestifer]AQY21321.1 hypothetical protein AB406_0362 [Riemerella anatipestifer]